MRSCQLSFATFLLLFTEVPSSIHGSRQLPLSFWSLLRMLASACVRYTEVSLNSAGADAERFEGGMTRMITSWVCCFSRGGLSFWDRRFLLLAWKQGFCGMLGFNPRWAGSRTMTGSRSPWHRRKFASKNGGFS